MPSSPAAVSNDQIDIIKRDAFRVEAIIDHFLVETGSVLFTRNPFLGNRQALTSWS
jgi:hypothetical protein